MRLWILIACVILTSMTSCQQEELPDPNGNEPVFGVEGKIAGEPRQLEAGREGYFMHTFFTKDSINQYNLTGQLGEPECKDCPGSLKIELPALYKAKEGLNISEALGKGARSYYNPVPMRKVNFQAFPDSQGTKAYFWKLGDSRTSNAPAPSHFYDANGPDTVTTTLRITYNNGQCVATSAQQIKLKPGRCRVNYRAKPVNQTEVIFHSETPHLQEPLSYRWYHGETLISKVAHPTYDFQKPGVYEVCLEVTGASGCSAQRCQRVDVFEDGCNANFNYQVAEDTTMADFDFINISWRNEEGKLYKTGKQQQPESSYFRILKSKPYEQNRKGYPTQKLTVAFDCMVYAADGSKKHLKDFKGTIAVAYPEK